MGQWRTATTGSQKFPRTATAVPVRVSTVEPETDPTTGVTFFRTAEETTANLSRGGAYVKSWEPLAAGRRVVLAMDLSPERDGSDELQIVGRVVWTRRRLSPDGREGIEQPGYGIEFVGGSRTELARLDAYLKGLAARPATAPAPAPGTVAPGT